MMDASVLKNNQDTGRLQALYLVNDMLRQVIAAGLDINTILPRVLRVALEELDGYSGSIIVIDEHFEVQYAWLNTGGETEEGANTFLKEVLDEGLFGWATRHQQTAVVKDTRLDVRWLPRPGHATASQPWSAICAPFIIRNRPIGAITMTSPGANQFSSKDANLLTAIANQAASTIESARLYEESKRRATELTHLVDATSAVSTSLETEEVFAVVAEQMTQFVQAEACIILDWNQDTHTLEKRHAYVDPTLTDTLSLPQTIDLDDLPLMQKVLQSPDIVHVTADDPNAGQVAGHFLEETGIESLLLLPLVARDRVVCLAKLVNIASARPLAKQEIGFVQTLANQAAVAIQNARLFENAQRQLKVSALLNEASRVINSTLDTNQIMQSLLAQMNELLHAEAISIALVDTQTNELVYEVAEGIGSAEIVGLRLPSNQGISGWVMEHGEPALVQNAAADPRFHRQGDERTGYDTHAMICAPLLAKGEVLGTIQAINPLQGTFTQDDLQLLVNLAHLASSALANAQQFARTQAAEERYVSLFQDSVNPILLTDPAGKIVEANRRAHEFLGYDRDVLLGLPLRELHPAGEEDRINTQLGQIDRDQVQMFPSRVLTRSEHLVPVEVYAKRTYYGDNELLQWIYRDISHQVELEEMREDLTAMLVHDLQSPLGNVISSLELLSYEFSPDSDPVVNSILDIATRSSHRLQTLISSLLDINHLEAGNPITDADYVRVDGLVQDAMETVRPTLERREIAVNREYSSPLPDVYVDEDMIRRVFINLLDNAVKYTPDDKGITIQVRPEKETDYLLVSVRDRGPGIPRQYRKVIFDKFRRIQGENAPQGMGLGLSFCRLAVEAHGGKIWVDDARGGGARFNFTLPTTPFKNNGNG